jgi:hypothetical protein
LRQQPGHNNLRFNRRDFYVGYDKTAKTGKPKGFDDFVFCKTKTTDNEIDNYRQVATPLSNQSGAAL